MSTQVLGRQIQQFLNEGKVHEARALLQCLIEENAEDDLLHYMMGNTYAKEHNWAKAMECYTRATELKADSPAREALVMLQDIMAFYCRDMYNP